MKTKTWTVDPKTGAVSQVGPFSHGLSALEVKANTKGEATAQILARAARMAAAGGPVLFIRNGAYCIATHDGNGWSAEAGTCHPRRANSDGSQFPLCSGGTFDRAADAVKHASFDYYSGEEWQADERRQYGPLGAVESDMLATLRSVMEWTGRQSDSTPVERRECLVRNAVITVLAKYDAKWLAAHNAADSRGMSVVEAELTATANA